MPGPASGSRASSIGSLGEVGTRSSAWSNSPTAASAVNSTTLTFNSNAVTPEASDRRALGFPVRCVQFRNRREQRPLAGFAEPPRNGAPNGASRVIKGVEQRTNAR